MWLRTRNVFGGSIITTYVYVLWLISNKGLLFSWMFAQLILIICFKYKCMHWHRASRKPLPRSQEQCLAPRNLYAAAQYARNRYDSLGCLSTQSLYDFQTEAVSILQQFGENAVSGQGMAERGRSAVLDYVEYITSSYVFPPLTASNVRPRIRRSRQRVLLWPQQCSVWSFYTSYWNFTYTAPDLYSESYRRNEVLWGAGGACCNMLLASNPRAPIYPKSYSSSGKNATAK